MNSSAQTVVVGGGVLGLAVAVVLTRRGQGVALVDPGGETASSLAAGMIAPALESVLDDLTPERAALLAQAARMWPDFARHLGVTLDLTPTRYLEPTPDVVAARLRALGFDVVCRDGVVITDDFRLDPGPALRAMRARIGDPAPSRALGVVREGQDWWVRTDTGTVAARHLVIATGTAPTLAGLPETVHRLIAAIVPVRGQVGRTPATLTPAVVRGVGGYLAPSEAGTIIGATMDVGRRDTTPDPVQAAALIDVARDLSGEPIDPDRVDWRVGIRGTSRDGLPLVGATDHEGLFLALAPRRNGWLLAPAIAGVVADAIEGRAPDTLARALDPLRPSLRAG